MTDGDEAAAIVNALQRHAAVVVQKSLAEGFGLTVAEAMWKSRPVVGSAVGGIVDQIVSGETGLPPRRSATTWRRSPRWWPISWPIPPRPTVWAATVRQRVNVQFLGDRHLQQWAEVVGHLV